MKISVSGFGKLFFILKEKYGKATNIELEIPKGTNVCQLISLLPLDTDDVEAAFVNGKIKSLEYIIKEKDRIGLVPPGTPGPYRVLLGIRKL